MFVSLEKIHPLPQAGSRDVDKLQYSRQVSQQPAQSSVAVGQTLPVKRGDRVVAHNKKGVACYGTVKWVGSQAGPNRTFHFPIVGLEMVRQCMPVVLFTFSVNVFTSLQDERVKNNENGGCIFI